MNSSVFSRGFAFVSLIMTLILVISCSIFIVKPLFYVVQSYCGGCYSDEEVLEITIDESGDMARHEKTEMEARIVVGGGIGIFCIALLNPPSSFEINVTFALYIFIKLVRSLLTQSGINICTGFPKYVPMAEIAIPVLPLVASTSGIPCFNVPLS